MKNQLLASLLISTSLLFISSAAHAQMKVGTNPTTLNANAVMEIESTTKGVLFPRLALSSPTSPSPMAAHVAGMVVYNTTNGGGLEPGLYANDGSQWIRAMKPAASCTCGQTTSGIVNSLGGDWVLMSGSGSFAANSCGLSGTIPNATGMVLVQGGTVGTTSAATALTQANLPNVNLTAASNGSHSHSATISTITPDGDPNFGNLTRTANWNDFGIGGSPDTYGPHTLNVNAAGAHTHNVPLGGSGTALTTANLPRLNVNYFVCVN